MRRIIFYSWQSDLPNPCNRGFIQDALEEAASAIATDKSVSIEPVVDRDTQNVPGSPDIASTIFAKIASSDVFVADVSIVTRAKGRRSTPNPNVLIELGYALKSLGHERIILVFNQAFGKIEELPFDLRTRRLLTYNTPESNTDRFTERKKLGARFDDAIRAALKTISEEKLPEVAIPAINAIENAQPNRTIILRRNLDDILKKIDRLEPIKHRDGGTVDELIEAIKKTQEPVAEFSKIVETIAVMNDTDLAIETCRWFGKLFEKYHLPENYNGRFSEADHDYFKFVGHEMFVTFVAFLIREQKWDMLRRILDEPIPMRYIRNQGAGNVNWEYASQHLSLLLAESPKRQRISLHADILRDRHSEKGGLVAILPINEFMNADFFLFLLREAIPDTTVFHMSYWRAWSCLFLNQPPLIIRASESKRVAMEVTKTLHLQNIDELKKLLIEKGPNLAKLFRHDGFWDYPIDKEHVEKIGTR